VKMICPHHKTCADYECIHRELHEKSHGCNFRCHHDDSTGCIPFEEPLRPPLGVVPKSIWLQCRAEDLSRAINEYVAGGFVGVERLDMVVGWCDQLSDVLLEMKYDQEGKNG
jgi:hypothetical protein